MILLFHFELKGLGDSGLEGRGGIGSFSRQHAHAPCLPAKASSVILSRRPPHHAWVLFPTCWSPPGCGSTQREGMLRGGALMSSLEQVHLDLGANHSSPQAWVAHSSAPWRPQEPEAGREFISGLFGNLRILSTQRCGFLTFCCCCLVICLCSSSTSPASQHCVTCPNLAVLLMPPFPPPSPLQKEKQSIGAWLCWGLSPQNS